MSLINSVLKVFVGDKSEKDVKALQPLVKEIKSFEQQLESMSSDELRQKTATFKSTIQEERKEIDDKIDVLKEEVQHSTDIDRNEEIYTDIDHLEEEAEGDVGGQGVVPRRPDVLLVAVHQPRVQHLLRRVAPRKPRSNQLFSLPPPSNLLL